MLTIYRIHVEIVLHPIGKAFNMLKLADYSEKEEIVHYVANSWSACWLSGYGAVMLAE